MNNFSDLIFLIAAIAIYGLLVHNTNRSLVLNNHILTDSEIKYGAISAAQDVLDEARWMKYDEATTNKLEGLKDNFVSDWYNRNVTINALAQSACPSAQACKKIDVTITSRFLNSSNNGSSVTMSMIKTRY